MIRTLLSRGSKGREISESTSSTHNCVSYIHTCSASLKFPRFYPEELDPRTPMSHADGPDVNWALSCGAWVISDWACVWTEQCIVSKRVDMLIVFLSPVTAFTSALNRQIFYFLIFKLCSTKEKKRKGMTNWSFSPGDNASVLLHVWNNRRTQTPSRVSTWKCL